MIHIVEGVPGSGKSYYAVKYLIDNFYKYDIFYNEYIEKDNKNVLVITNIDNFKPKHLNLDVLIERFTLEKFFTVENFEKIRDKFKVKNIVLIIDEAQRYFDRKFFNKDVFYFFQYHRHLGVDIFLITQNKNTISREIVVLAEYIVRAVPRSVQPNSFVYHFFDVDGNKLFSKALKKDKKIFNAYSSMKVEEVNKPKNVVLSKLLVYSSIIVLSVSALFYSLYSWRNSYAKNEVSQKQTQTQYIKTQVKNAGVPKVIDQVEESNNKYNNSVIYTEEKLQEYIKEYSKAHLVVDNPDYKMISITRDDLPETAKDWICIDGTNQCYQIFEK